MKASLAAILIPLLATVVQAQDVKQQKDIDAAVAKGLAWLAKQQAGDGHFSDAAGFPVATTAFAGLALLAEGSTLEQGKYRAHLRLALDWLLKQKSDGKLYYGLIGDVNEPRTTGRYMPQHGVALSFLAKFFGEIEDKEQRAKVRARLDDAIGFAVDAQSSLGGWFYTSKAEGHDQSENVATMLVIQGLLDARDAGLLVPAKTLKKAHDYIKDCTTPRGGILYAARADKSNVGGGRPSITAMALAAYVPRQRPYDGTTRRWLSFCAEQPTLEASALKNGDLLVPYFWTRVACQLDAEEWRAAFPDKKLPDHLNWSKYRKVLFEHLRAEQADDGSWTGRGFSLGPVFNTSLALNIILFEKTLPLSR